MHIPKFTCTWQFNFCQMGLVILTRHIYNVWAMNNILKLYDQYSFQHEQNQNFQNNCIHKHDLTRCSNKQPKGQRSLTWFQCAGSVTYLKLMKPKGLGELCAAKSDLAIQTGIEKTDLLIIHKPNLTSSHFKKPINRPWKPEARNRTRPGFYACPGYQRLRWWFNQKWMS